jgi:hypothetical protein
VIAGVGAGAFAPKAARQKPGSGKMTGPAKKAARTRRR